MTAISGKYELVSQENIYEYMLSLGDTPENAKKTTEEGISMILEADESKVIIDAFGRRTTFLFGQETTETLPSGHPITSTAQLDGNILTIRTTIVEGLTQERVFTFSGDEVVVIVTNSLGVSAKRIYKKI